MRIVIGQAWDPHRIMINHDDYNQQRWDNGLRMDVAGWTHKMEFWVYPSKQTIRIAVGQAWEPHRIMINHDNCNQKRWDGGLKMNVAGWKHHMDFWAFSTQQPGTMRIVIGQAWDPHRIMINHDDYNQDRWDGGLRMDVAGWTHKMEFWVYPFKP